MKTYVVYSSLDENGAAEKQAIRLAGLNLQQSFELVDMSQGADALDLLVSLFPDDVIVVCGGDAILNRFISETEGIDIDNDLYYLACGDRNHFREHTDADFQSAPIRINEYLRNRPVV